MTEAYLLFDFGLFRDSGSTREPLFTAGLIDQYEKLALNKELDFDDYIRIHIMGQNTVYVSLPNLDREVAISRNDYGRFINNVAIRFENKSDGNDLVLIGDIVSRTNNSGFTTTTYNVKGILTMDPHVVHYGEIKSDNIIVIKLTKDGMWEDGNNITQWPTDRQKTDNLFTNDYITHLVGSTIDDGKFVVKNTSEVLNILNDWDEYLRSRRYLIEESSKTGFSLIDAPEIIRAYFTDIITSGIPDDIRPAHQLLADNNRGKHWTLDKLNDASRPGIIFHAWYDVNYKEYEEGKGKRNNIESKINSFTRNPYALVDPTIRFDPYGSKRNSVLIIRDGKITNSIIQKIEPEQEIKELDQELEMRLSRSERKTNDEFKAQVKEDLNKFSSGELIEILSTFENDQYPAVSNRIRDHIEKIIVAEKSTLSKKIANYENKLIHKNEELSQIKIEISSAENKIKSIQDENNKLLKTVGDDLKKLDGDNKKKFENLNKQLSSYKKNLDSLNAQMKKVTSECSWTQEEIEKINREIVSLDSKYDPEQKISDEISNMVNVRRNFLTDNKKNELMEKHKPEFNQKLKTEQIDIKTDIRARKEFAIEEHSVARLHIFQELELPETNNIDSLIKDYSSRMRPGLALRKDFSGDLAIIDRQTKALDNLRKGYVMNPFLATSLFSPVSTGELAQKDVKFYLQDLNEGQKEAIRKALSSNGLFLLQGPPGTGKTQVIAELTAQLVTEGKKVLIASENNKAVDNAFGRLPKIPAIRPMRILSERAKSRDNPHAMGALLKNFYENIIGSLSTEISKYDNSQKYESKMKDYIDSLKQKLDSIGNSKTELDSIQKLIDELETKLNTKWRTLEKRRSENDSINQKIEDLRDKMNEISSFENEEFSHSLLNRIRDECDIDLQNADYEGIFKSIFRFDDDVISDEYELYNAHKKLFELFEKKKQMAGGGIVSINKEIHMYEEENSINIIDFRIITLFPTVPTKKSIRQMKEIITEEVDDMISSKKLDIENLRDESWDTSSIEMEIEKLKSELEELRQNPKYLDLEMKKTEFFNIVNGFFRELNIPRTFKKEEEAIEILEDERERISREIKSNNKDLEERIDAYKKISKYLKTETLVEKDSDTYNPDLLECVNVIGMTCSMNNKFENQFNNDEKIKLSELNIDVVIIDEVSKIPFIELLQPILFGKTVVLVGDHKQLPPMYPGKIDDDEMDKYDSNIINPKLEEKYRGMFENKSFFEELFEKTPESNKIMLRTQYRMHRAIMNIDNVFYGGKLELGCRDDQKLHYLDVEGPHRKKIITEKNHVLFIDCKGQEVQESGSKSFFNREEATVVRKLLELIDKNCKYDRNGQRLGYEYDTRKDERLSVGVICPYRDQANLIKGKKTQKYKSFNDSSEERFMVDAVDNFQGDERDIIILSMVRTRDSKFLKDYHRINVAVSRARRLLIIVGNKAALEPMLTKLDGRSVPIYKNIINTIDRDNGCLTQSDIVGVE